MHNVARSRSFFRRAATIAVASVVLGLVTGVAAANISSTAGHRFHPADIQCRSGCGTQYYGMDLLNSQLSAPGQGYNLSGSLRSVIGNIGSYSSSETFVTVYCVGSTGGFEAILTDIFGNQATWRSPSTVSCNGSGWQTRDLGLPPLTSDTALSVRGQLDEGGAIGSAYQD
jgi:hypothetical protein